MGSCEPCHGVPTEVGILALHGAVHKAGTGMRRDSDDTGMGEEPRGEDRTPDSQNDGSTGHLSEADEVLRKKTKTKTN